MVFLSLVVVSQWSLHVKMSGRHATEMACCLSNGDLLRMISQMMEVRRVAMCEKSFSGRGGTWTLELPSPGHAVWLVLSCGGLARETETS